MKKSIKTTLLGSAAVLMSVSLAACGNSNADNSTKKDNAPKTEKVRSKESKINSSVQENAQSSEQKSLSSSESSKTSSSSSAQKGWTLESAKNYYLATVRGNDGNPLKLVGDIPTQAQNGKTWELQIMVKQ